eukprot:651223-Prymnesium_polylepis.2
MCASARGAPLKRATSETGPTLLICNTICTKSCIGQTPPHRAAAGSPPEDEDGRDGPGRALGV